MRLVIAALFMSLMMVSQIEAKTVAAVALFKDRAMLSIDGKKAKIVRAGTSYQGVKVISSSTSEAVIEIDGTRKTLKVVLYENEVGFFESDGQVNGRSIKFLIDTGANLVVFSSSDAQRLGLDYESGEKGVASTASGVAPMYRINIDSISIGGVELENITAGVIEGSFPQTPLLGMTFLSRLNMNRTGQTMVCGYELIQNFQHEHNNVKFYRYYRIRLPHRELRLLQTLGCCRLVQ